MTSTLILPEDVVPPPQRRWSRLRDIKPLRERNPLTVGLVGLLVLAFVIWLAFSASSLPLIGGGTGYSAYFSEAAGLTPGNEVRVAGVRVGQVTGVSLAGNRVRVTFTVKNTWVGDASTVAIAIKTILGAKYLAVDPLGGAPQDPSVAIPQSRTTSPYDVTQAFNQLGEVFGQLNTQQMASSLETISQAFANTPAVVHESLTGLAALSQAIASQDTELAQLLAGTKKITGTIAAQDSEFQTLINDGNLLLAELRLQQQSIASLLTGTEQLATQLSSLVKRNNAEIGPLLTKLGQVTSTLQANQSSLNKALALLGPYSRVVGNTLGNGRWFDAYLCGLVQPQYGGTQPSSGCMPPKIGG
ncbi:MAG: MCE family protein [Actinobacteria bacterium]|nr:MCE family protein [Actinomycetota bacterium]MBO0830652.1 MCE family protein [Actinomycetota bacterium]MBO0833979.1 MCE family protein [Actinomycetota bacterium]